LSLTQFRKPITNPPGLRDGNIVEETAALATVIKLDPVAFDSYDKLGLEIVLWFIARSREKAAGFAKGAAEVTDDVAQLLLAGLLVLL